MKGRSCVRREWHCSSEKGDNCVNRQKPAILWSIDTDQALADEVNVVGLNSCANFVEAMMFASSSRACKLFSWIEKWEYCQPVLHVCQ